MTFTLLNFVRLERLVMQLQPPEAFRGTSPCHKLGKFYWVYPSERIGMSRVHVDVLDAHGKTQNHGGRNLLVLRLMIQTLSILY
jgi:hypothetical protein